MKRFNVTGLCVPEEDYMVDISGKIEQIKKLIDNRYYFTIEKPPKYGKTTILKALERTLINEYTVISLNFGQFNENSFESSEQFCTEFIKQGAEALQDLGCEKEYIQKWVDYSIADVYSLSEHIGEMCKNRKVILIVDDADKNSHNKVFLDFLSMLRQKYTDSRNDKVPTFYSVIFASVYDIKNIKLSFPSYYAPWNIAADFNVDFSFNSTEIATMLNEYESDHNTGMNIAEISEEIYGYTSGYPFLVSRICQCIDEELNKNWKSNGINDAVKILLEEANTLFDDMFKNIRTYEKLRNLLYDILFIGRSIPFNIYDEIINLGSMFGFLKSVNGQTKISNKIFKTLIYNYFVVQEIIE